ncbi:MAG: LytR/AlgR family response regulator transcription factor [Acutalibacteraceae bacterium]
MKIGICDDVFEYCSSIKGYVEYYLKMNNIKYEIHTFLNGKDLINSNINFDILFLDIELEDISGITVAEHMLNYSPNTIIIIVTNYRKYLDAAMDLNALRFIDKPVTQERIASVLEKAISEINNGSITIHTKTNEIKKIKKSDIIYVEVVRKTTSFYTKNGIVECNQPITKFRDVLNSSYFAIPHNSYIVNLNYVLSYKRDKLQMDFGEETHTISIATRKQHEFKKKFMNFIGESR